MNIIYMLPFSKPYYNKQCLEDIENASINDISYIDKCETFLTNKYKFPHCILTTSCTHALEMMAMILDIGIGDEVLIPSYTFVSTANAFVKFGASIKCIDSCKDNPNIDPDKIEKAITKKTKALVIVHYAGSACDMDKISFICKKHNIILLEDAAQAINSYYKGKALGTFGLLSAFSFHSTKNVNCGEGGLLVVNDTSLIGKARVIYEKGTNRYEFTNGTINKYEWIAKGSSYPLSNINAAYLYSQLLNIDAIINERKNLWDYYKSNLQDIENKKICKLSNNSGNYHIFYMVFEKRVDLINIKKYLKKNGITSNTHYVPLHNSSYYINNFDDIILPNSKRFGDNLLRLPLYYDLKIENTKVICNLINNYFMFDIEYIHHKEINSKKIKDIIGLKSQFWLYNYDSQISWIKKNVKPHDVHILIYKDSQLIGYGLILKRNCNIVDSIIINEKYRGMGYGGYLINFINNKIKANGFLLCEKHNILYYNKYGWEQDVNIKIFNKKVENNLYMMKYKLKINDILY